MKNQNKLSLKIEDLEERIAPHNVMANCDGVVNADGTGANLGHAATENASGNSAVASLSIGHRSCFN